MGFSKKSGKKSYPLLLSLTGILVFIGLVLIFSASRVVGRSLADLFGKQLLWTALGFGTLAFFYKSDFHFWSRSSIFFYLVSLALLASVLVFGQGRAEVQRWFKVGFFYFQPSEFAKLIYIFTLGNYFERNKDSVKRFTTFLWAFLFIFLPLFILILLQPNLGTAFVFLPIFFAVAYIAGTPKKHLLTLSGLGLLALPVFWLFLRDYQKRRILVFLNPGIDPLGAGYNILQSRIAIGSGGFFGKGFLRGTQTHLAFLPEHHTDFIFSVLAEEWGFLGGIALLLVYFLFLTEVFKIASFTRDRAGTFIAVGFGTMFATHIFVNVAMAMGFLPVVGIPLPFLSYGGSSLIASLTAVGILLSIKRQETFL